MTGFMERKVGHFGAFSARESLEIDVLARAQAGTFVAELWQHLLSAQVGRSLRLVGAQESPVGVPREFIDQKKVAFEAFSQLVWQEELKKKKEEAEKVQAELKRRKWWAQELSACSLLGWEVAEGRVRGGGAAGESFQGAVTAQGRPSLSEWGLAAVGRSDRTERGRGPLRGRKGCCRARQGRALTCAGATTRAVGVRA